METMAILLEIDADDPAAALRRIAHMCDEWEENPPREFSVAQWGWCYGGIFGSASKHINPPPSPLRLQPSGQIIMDVLDYNPRSGYWKLLLANGEIVDTTTDDQPKLYPLLTDWSQQKRSAHLWSIFMDAKEKQPKRDRW